MSTLFLVRHAQASFLESEYDRLCPAGQTQAGLLGAYWRERGLAFDAVYTGPCRRQVGTATQVGEGYAAAGLAFPSPVILAELDEHQADQLLRTALPELTKHHPPLEDLAAAYGQAQSAFDKHRSFQRLFEAVVRLWSTGTCPLADLEPWPVFRARVRAGLARILREPGHGRRVAVFTSVGPISVALQHALQCTDRVALELGWRLRNCSVSEFVFTRDRFTLDAFNTVPHLNDPALWTYR